MYVCIYIDPIPQSSVANHFLIVMHPSGTWAIGADLRHPAVAPCFPCHWRGSFCVAFALQWSKDWGPRKLPMESNIWVSENGVYYHHMRLGVYFVFQTISCYPHKFPVIFLLIDVENIMISPLLKVITAYVSIRIGNVLSSSAFLPAAANLSISLLLGPLPGMPMVIPKTWTVSSASKPARCISCKAAGVRAPSCVFPGWVFNRTMFSNSCHSCKKDRNEGISLAAAARSSIYKVWNGVPKFLDIPHYQTHGFLESTNLPIHGFLQLWNQ